MMMQHLSGLGGRKVRRRDFITLLGGTVAWPLAARAQQRTPRPVIGFLNPVSPEGYADRLLWFSQGLKEAGYTVGDNVALEYRWADGQLDRLPGMAADLVARGVAVIVAVGAAAPVAKSATATTPIVFFIGQDPVALGLVANVARPGGNLTGINPLSQEVVAKRLGLLREAVPRVQRVAVLESPLGMSTSEVTTADMDAAGRTLGIQLQKYKAGTIGEINTAFAMMANDRPDALFVAGDPFFGSRRVQLVQMASYHRLPATYGSREYTEVGGLMSYGADLVDPYRQLGLYTGRILKGAKPADLPVLQASKIDLVVNQQTARMLGLVLSPTLLAIADEVIE
jgi:putative ABC transport system substrate-binding protein